MDNVLGPHGNTQDIRNGPDCTVIVRLSYYSLLSFVEAEFTLAGPMKAIENLSLKILLRSTETQMQNPDWSQKSTVESSFMSTITNHLKQPMFPIRVKTLKTSHERD
ncbi:hypothetical protein CLF_108109 [Clonorchis sinensis]|uniref:Uncharacterized protein n=1 Tax=Clonorchis sinensis TaxID=79923 RepID=G7YRA4_CLOSI|nr:hypothetical protein CLF_108109 [Clonorchis sinensis]